MSDKGRLLEVSGLDRVLHHLQTGGEILGEGLYKATARLKSESSALVRISTRRLGHGDKLAGFVIRVRCLETLRLDARRTFLAPLCAVKIYAPVFE